MRMASAQSVSPRVNLSFEFFPPKTPEGADKLRAVRQRLYARQPEFCSVTFGAGGSTQEGTLQTVRGHLRDFQAAGVKRLVALRGDLPSGYGIGGEFHHASDLVAFIRDEMGSAFHIEVAAYPEMHPQARSPLDDLQHFADKVRAGANSAITQYFYSAAAYRRFVDDVRALGLDVPVVPGIMPITNSSQLLRFSEVCGAEIPRWIRLRLQSYGDDRESIRAFGREVVSSLCEELIASGAPGLHFYTLNQAEATLAVLDDLGR